MKILKNITCLLIVTLLVTGCSFGKETVKVEIPELKNVNEATAYATLKKLNLEPNVEYQYDESVEEGNVISASIGTGSLVDENTSITLYVSKGSNTILAKRGNIAWWDVSTSEGDKITKVNTPKINENYLILSFEITYNSLTDMTLEDTGIASLSEKFDKIVPVGYSISGTPKYGSSVKITAAIPVDQLSSNLKVETVWFTIGAKVGKSSETLLYKASIEWND